MPFSDYFLPTLKRGLARLGPLLCCAGMSTQRHAHPLWVFLQIICFNVLGDLRAGAISIDKGLSPFSWLFPRILGPPSTDEHLGGC